MNKIFQPIGKTSKKNKKHKRIIHQRAGIMRKRLPVHQDIATYIVRRICDEMCISPSKSEAPSFSNHTKRWYLRDIYIPDLKLIIEIDGSSHNFQKEYDKNRDDSFDRKGIKTVRFKNEETDNLNFRWKIITEFQKRIEEITNYYQIEDRCENILKDCDSIKEVKKFVRENSTRPLLIFKIYQNNRVLINLYK